MNEHQTDEEAIGFKIPAREQLLETATIERGIPLGDMTVRKITAETLSYLFQIENFFIRGLQGERASANNANAIWSTAEFIYIHTANPDEVASLVWNRIAFRSAIRDFLSGPFNDPKLLTDSLPIIEKLVGEYFAAQSKVVATPGRSKVVMPGKQQARHGKRPI
jgi:hypothetical protein